LFAGCDYSAAVPLHLASVRIFITYTYCVSLVCSTGALTKVLSTSEPTLTILLCLPLGAQIYRLNGTDPEGQEVRYGLSFDPGSKEYFRIDPKSGNITLVEKLDREVK